MKKFYSQLRIALLTFTLGLAGVPFASGLYKKWSEPDVEVPQVESDAPIVVILPTEEHPFDMVGGGARGKIVLTEIPAQTSKSKRVKSCWR